MASNETVLKIRAEIENLQGLNQLKTALRKSSAEAKGADNDFRGLVQKVRELQSASVKSVNNLNAQRDAFEALRRSADVTSKEFKEARDEIEKIDKELKKASGTVVKYSKNSINALRSQKKEFLAVRDSADLMSKEFKEAGIELAKLDKKLAKAEGRKTGGGRLRSGAQVLGTVAGAGVFGGPEGAAGAVLGSIVGGVPGAVVGGAIGAQLSQIRKLGAEIATYKAEIDKLNIALRNVAGLEYADAMIAITRASEDFNVPFKQATRTFTRLVAAGTANGNTVRELEGLYRGLSAATKATGGSTEDLNGVLLAATQVLSKGKVSAEELRGQIGERLPGAFSLFAQATGRTTQQLDEDLKAGAVSAEEFVNEFASFINNKYKNAAAEIADSPSEAGARLERTLKNLQVAIGPILQGIGAEFQIFANEALTALTPLLQEINKFFKLDRSGKNTRLANLEKNKIPEMERLIRDLAGRDGDSFVGIPKAVAGMFDNPGSLKSVDYVFQQAGKQLVELRGRARQLRLELFPKAGAEVDLPNTKLTKDLNGDDPSGSGIDKVGKAIEGVNKLMIKLKKLSQGVGLKIKGVGATAEEEIENKFSESMMKANNVIGDQIRILTGYEKTIGTSLPKARDEIDKLRTAYEKLAKAERDDAMQDLADKKFGDRLKSYGFTGESLDSGGKIFASGALDEQAFPTGIDSILNPNKLKTTVKELKDSLEELTNPANQVIGAANAIGTAFTDSFKSVIDGSATTQEALAGFFKNIANYFLDMAMQIIQKMITMYILNQVVGLLPGLGGGGGGGDIFSDISGRGGLRMADGGVFAKNKIVPYAKGGIVDKPTMFAYANGGAGRFGLMGEAGPEAIMPLQRGPGGKLGVQASGGGGVSVGNINITVENTGDQLNAAAQKQLAGQVQGIVLSTLANERRSGGML